MSTTLGELASFLQAELHGDASLIVSKVDTLQGATTGALSFLSNRRYRKFLANTGASAVILAEPDRIECPCAALVMENPYLGYAKAATILNPVATRAGGIHPSAVVADDASVAASAYIGANSVVGSESVIADSVHVGPGCVIGVGVHIGRHSRLTANVTLCDQVSVGERAIVHPGVVIGADGFGIANDEGAWVKVPQLGRVCVGDDVEIGANTAIDRGALEDTLIGNGVKIDNLVQIGHNVRIGEHTAIAGCVGIAGSVKIGARCTVGGMTAIAGHLEIADDVHLTGGSAVPNSILEAGIYSSGMPIQPNRIWRKNAVRLRQLDELVQRVRKLESRSK